MSAQRPPGEPPAGWHSAERGRLRGHQSKLGFDRLVFFSDAVCAIAMTILAFDLHLPAAAELHGISEAALWRAVGSLWPKYLSFAVSFLVIGMYWISHHRMFRLINRFDDLLVWINLLFLMCVAVIPFPTTLLGEHAGKTAAVVPYAGVLALTGLLQAAIWLYATPHRRLVEVELDDTQYHYLVRLVTLRVGVPPLVFLLSMAVAVRWPTVAMFTWLLIAVHLMLVGALGRRMPVA